MIRTLKATNFGAVPYLETSQLMQSHPDGLVFSLEKPNVIVGANGVGKSALMRTLSYLTLSWQTGVSTIETFYASRQCEACWPASPYGSVSSRSTTTYLPGLDVESDWGPALYYRPGHIPGNEAMLVTAKAIGYGAEATEYRRLTAGKSSGQQCGALLGRLDAVLAGDTSSMQYLAAGMHWAHEFYKDSMPAEHVRSHYLLRRYGEVSADALPVLLLDEPEQSLDTKAELQFWRKVESVDTSKVQVIAATHSLYPMMYPGRFNVIEATPGYVAEVLALLR